MFVQMGTNHLNKNYNVYLKDAMTNSRLSEIKVINGGQGQNGVLVQLMVEQTLLSGLEKKPTYVQLVAESSPQDRHSTWVWLSQHRGYIFIQTNQPVYKPMDTVKFRVFTLDHAFRPWTEQFHLSVKNAAGHRVMNAVYSSKEGLLAKHFVIPDVAKTGTWKMTAHYDGDHAANAVSTEFKVQKFVMPTFEVNIQMDQNYLLVTETEMTLTLTARYSHAHSVNGAYHCQFGVIQKGSQAKPVYIRGMEQAGSVKDGDARLSVNVTKLNTLTENQLERTLSDIAERGELLYLGVFVTNIQNGEIQEHQISIPVVTHKYEIDLSRTRSHFVPGFPLDVAVLVRLPDGSPAEKVPVTITLMEETEHRQTDQQGAVFHTFNAKSAGTMNLTVTAEDTTQTKDLHATDSPTGSYLQMSVDYREYSVRESLRVIFNTKNAPDSGHIHYLVLSRGSIIQEGRVQLAKQSVVRLPISENMVPSFRLIGYFYTPNNDIISDSLWLAVKGNCEEKVTVELKGNFKPGGLPNINIDLRGQKAEVALLAVDTALYGLKADNKLTPEQVYSSMEAYDLGCSYGGGANPESVMTDAGLAFSTKTRTAWRKADFQCNSKTRHKRSVDLEQEMMDLKSKYNNETLQSCCAKGFLLLPMQRTCDERAERVSKMQNDPNCTEAFRSCCEEGQRLRTQKAREEGKKGLGRTSSLSEIQEYFLNNDNAYLRKTFHSSFAFESFTVNGIKRHSLSLPDSITTWEIQIITLSKESGLCVTNPSLLRVFKPVFVSLRFPYSVRKYEQMYISPVIYNYANTDLHVAVHMEQSEGLCSPGSATAASFVNITVSAGSSQTVIFSAVPMKSGSIPIKIRLYDIDRQNEIDAIEKILKVWTEGVEKTEEASILIHLNETNEVSRTINGKFPDDTVPESPSTIFITMEENGFGPSHVKNLLAVSVPKLTIQPYHCLEQTTSRLVPTAIAVHYLDMSDQWINMAPGARDEALENIQNGVNRIVQIVNTNRGSRGGYGSWPNMQPSTWLTSHVVKVLSVLGKRQLFTFGQEGRKAINVPISEITEAVTYLRSKQTANDGSFSDYHPVVHREVEGKDRQALMTAFVTLALSHSLELLGNQDKIATESVISKATDYLWSNFNQLSHPLAVAITVYTLSVHKDYTQRVRRRIDWATFEATSGSATAVGTAAYALLAAVTLKERQQAHKFAHWLTTQENSLGGFYSTQDTLVALEALAEYELMEPVSSEANVHASFTVKGRNDVEKLHLQKEVKVERDLKRFLGKEITANFKGHGTAKVKVVKVYHLMEPKDICEDLSIEVTVKGEVSYTAQIIEDYEDYGDDDISKTDEPAGPRSDIEWFDIRTRRRRQVNDQQAADQFVVYEVCVQHSPSYNLTGMAIVDITLLSGFVATPEDLEDLKSPPEQYISHFELSQGKVLIYLDQLLEQKQCFEFRAKQVYAVGLLQPAPAVFYDYYEPNQRCTVFYSAPKRSKVVSKLCSEDVCQCAERPCHKLQNTFGQTEEDGYIRKTSERRQDHACFYPIVDYAYMVKVVEVSEKNNFELYKATVTDVLKLRGDSLVNTGSHRVFAKRRQCRNRLEVGTEYLIMGMDGSTTDSHGQMQYLLEVSTWVEPRPTNCERTAHEEGCNEFNKFVKEFKISSCKQ